MTIRDLYDEVVEKYCLKLSHPSFRKWKLTLTLIAIFQSITLGRDGVVTLYMPHGQAVAVRVCSALLG